MIIQRYISKEVRWSFLATMLILLLIIVGNTFVKLLAKVSTGDLPLDVLGKMVLLGSISGGLQLVPIALLIGMMLAFGRLYQDHEMEALNAAGTGPFEFYKGIARFVVPLTLIVALLVLWIVPQIETLNNDIKNEVKQRPEAAGIPVGEFMQAGKGKRRFTLFVEALDEEQVVMQRFFMHTLINNEESIVLAEGAILFIDKTNGERVLQISSGSRYSRDLNTDEFKVFQFSEHGVRVPPLNVSSSLDLDTTPTLQLLREKSLEAKAELHWRFAVILATPVMAFLAFPLSFSTPRQGRFGKLALGILLFAVYFNLLITGVSMLEKGKTPVWLGLWWVHLIFIVLGLWMLKRRYGARRQKASADQ
jgi:lipopolysaccharide export system permease protein